MDEQELLTLLISMMQLTYFTLDFSAVCTDDMLS